MKKKVLRKKMKKKGGEEMERGSCSQFVRIFYPAAKGERAADLQKEGGRGI